jgi:hypothetical protein
VGLRGLAWTLSFLPPRPDIARALGALVETSLRRIAGHGPRDPKVANAGVMALSRIDGEAALAELARLATRVTYKGTLKLVDKALEARAEAMGLSRGDIEELAIPAYGLTELGRAVREFGGAGSAELVVQGSRGALTWRNGAGKASKSVPAAIRQEHQEELKEFKATVGDIDKMLPALAQRLDRQFAARRTWTYTAWRDRYPDHPLAGAIARRLLWTVDGKSCGFADGKLRTLAGAPVAGGPRSSCGTPSDASPPRFSPGGTGLSTTASRSRSSRPIARCTCSPTRNATPGPTPTASPGTSCASISSTP